MKKSRPITFEFVDSVPSQREEGKLYISMMYRTAIHNCFCGCGMKVVTPIRPTGWTLTYDGDAVTLDPSVGNWSFKCRSHYIIQKSVAIPAGSMTKDEIQSGRRRDRAIRDDYYGKDAKPTAKPSKKRGLLDRIFGREK